MFVVLALPGPAQAFVTHRKLDRLVSILAERPVKARCLSQREWDADRENSDALAFTLLRDPRHPNQVLDYTSLSAPICVGAFAIGSPGQASLASEAIAALVITHEAYHLRIWRLRGSEPAVECRAIRNVRRAVQLLGGSAKLADALLPYALVDHYDEELTDPYYADPSCVVPQLPDTKYVAEARSTAPGPVVSGAGSDWQHTGIVAAGGFALSLLAGGAFLLRQKHDARNRNPQASAGESKAGPWALRKGRPLEAATRGGLFGRPGAGRT